MYRSSSAGSCQIAIAVMLNAASRKPTAAVAKALGDARPVVRESAADHAVERMEAELQSRRHAEVAASAAEAPEQLGVLVGVVDRPVRGDDLRADEVVARQAVLRGQVA